MLGHRRPLLGLFAGLSATVARWGGVAGPVVPAGGAGAARGAGRPEGVDPLAAAYAAGAVDATELLYCPRERRTRPHAVAADGRRRCWDCGCETDDCQ